jgi:lysozyme
MTMTPRVVDVSHHQPKIDMDKLAAAGIWGVIHKATQGSNYKDPDYVRRRDAAKAAGINWGAYHFNDGSDVASQVKNFIGYAKPDADTLVVLDFEDNPKSNMTMRQAVQFLRQMEKQGYKCAIYSGNRLKEHINDLPTADREYVTSHLLWLCQYGPRAVLPVGFNEYFLWQYTGDGIGQTPHEIDGIENDNGTTVRGVDLNVFEGTRDELDAKWPSILTSTDLSARRSTHSDAAELDGATPSHSSRADDDVKPLPPFLRRKAPEPGGLNVQPVRVRYRVAVQVVQQQLDDLGYHEVGEIDGNWGGKTASAITAFFTDRGLSAKPELGPELDDALDDAIEEGWKRPVSVKRATAKPEDIAPHSESIRVNLWQRFWAKFGVAAGGLGLGGTTLSGAFHSVQDQYGFVHDTFSKIPPEAWFCAVMAIAGAVWYATNRAAKATARDFNAGRLN